MARRRGVRNLFTSVPIVVALLSVLSLAFIGGCSSQSSSAARTRPTTPARLEIVTPVPNAATGANVLVTLRLDHARLVAPTEGVTVVPNRGHVHVSVDGQLTAMPSQLHVTVPALRPGPHTISVEFVASDHLPFRNRVVAVVSFHVA